MSNTNDLPEVIIEFEELFKRKDDISKSEGPRRAPKIQNKYQEKHEGFI